MKTKKIHLFLLSMVMVFSFGLFPFSVLAASNHQAPTTINVALYGYVPDTERFEKAVKNAWNAIEPNVQLNFVDWDCYEEEPNQNLDVFVFDSIYLQHYVSEGYLLPIAPNEIQNKDDLLPFALSGTTMNGNIYALPQIICTNLLYYRKNDTQIQNVNTVTDLYQILGDRQTNTIIPAPNEGLLFDMSGGTTKVCLYLDALIDQTGLYTTYTQLPTSFKPQVVSYLEMFQSMAGKAQANYYPDNNDAYIRGKWFSEGKGRTYLGYTEAMSTMGDFVNDIDFKTISYSRFDNIPIFYGDVIGINAIGATDTMVDALSPDQNNPYPQYLLPARESVYDTMNLTYPIYGKLHTIATNPANKLFLIGPEINEWMPNAKSVIKNLLNQANPVPAYVSNNAA
jgi:thiamine pyridinylase